MRKRSLAIVLFCVVSSVVMTSCVKESLDGAKKPFASIAKAAALCAHVVYRTILKKKKTAVVHCNCDHTHVEEPAAAVLPDTPEVSEPVLPEGK